MRTLANKENGGVMFDCGPLSSAMKPLKPRRSVFVWRIFQSKIKPWACVKDCLVMGEGLKAIFAVIRADATGSDAAKGQVRASQVMGDVVNAAAAEGIFFH